MQEEQDPTICQLCMGEKTIYTDSGPFSDNEQEYSCKCNTRVDGEGEDGPLEDNEL